MAKTSNGSNKTQLPQASPSKVAAPPPSGQQAHATGAATKSGGSPQQPDKSIPYEQIARRAYEIYQARGGQEGRHVEDWLQAERELKLGRQ